ncbi:TonB-dependent siderophore receptor [Carboxylicivirga sp. M1479]|uniref:TonB-dependent receptor plug domain-containing protein n=1 Tax=Carboxylicivirga sp. M1479 TaxID=2594476 RepID=UPI00163D5E64|nr:TonB-dependent receptor [Carboxylicivirga sp. M1479]
MKIQPFSAKRLWSYTATFVCLLHLTPLKGQADIDPLPLSKECTIKIVDPVDETPLIGAHICIELADGRKVYEVSDVNGNARLLYANKKGVVAISSMGYVTSYLALEGINDGASIPLKTDVFNIDQVIVTGSSQPMPVDSSIYKVKLISEEKIQQSGAVNLSEILMTEANIRMSNDLVLGSQIEMLGMSGQNVKIMIDGVPVIGRLDGNVDLSQINLANVKQIEVIEGPMSVVYGNNALAGTINIITKKNFYHELSGQVNAYAESVGRYAGNASVAKKWGAHTVSAEGGYEYFSGVNFDESTRQMDWKPKNLYRFNTNYSYNKNDWQLTGRFGMYSDELYHKSNLSGTKVYDTYYYTSRYDFSIGLNKIWEKGNSLNVVSSYNLYDRSSQNLTKDLSTLEEHWSEIETTQEANQKMVRAIYSQAIVPGVLSYQAGADINVETMEGPRIADGAQSLGDYAAFLNVNYSIVPNFEIQPGVRYAYNTDYKAPLVYSINTKWQVKEGFNWRASAAKGFRAPSVKELHYEFVDSNHEIFGNPDLSAESSYNFNTSVDYSFEKDAHSWRLSASAYYNDVENMIALVQDEGSTQYYYQNIDQYQSTGANFEINYGFKKNLTLRAGYGITGRLNSYATANGSDKYNVTNDFFAGVKWIEPHTNITVAIDYKYNGELPFFFTDADGEINEGFQAAYHTMNASLSKSFFKRKLLMTAGAKNLFDVTSVNRISGGGSAHSSGGNVPISYGRSFFISLTYKFNHSNN